MAKYSKSILLLYSHANGFECCGGILRGAWEPLCYRLGPVASCNIGRHACRGVGGRGRAGGRGLVGGVGREEGAGLGVRDPP